LAVTAPKPLSRKTAAGCSEDLDVVGSEVERPASTRQRLFGSAAARLHSWRGQQGDDDAFPLMKREHSRNTTDCTCQLDRTYTQTATPTIQTHYITQNYGRSPATQRTYTSERVSLFSSVTRTRAIAAVAGVDGR